MSTKVIQGYKSAVGSGLLSLALCHHVSFVDMIHEGSGHFWLYKQVSTSFIN